jgi:hypothetical protein
MQKVVENLEKKVIYSELSTWAQVYEHEPVRHNKLFVIPKIKEKRLTSNWSEANKGYNVYTKNTKIYVSLANTNYSNEYLFVQVSCRDFHLGFWWYPNSHSIMRIIDWELEKDGSGEAVHEVKKGKKNTYNVNYNTVIKFINIVCRPPPRIDSPLFKQLAVNVPVSYDLLFIILNYLYVSLI